MSHLCEIWASKFDSRGVVRYLSSTPTINWLRTHLTFPLPLLQGHNPTFQFQIHVRPHPHHTTWRGVNKRCHLNPVFLNPCASTSVFSILQKNLNSNAFLHTERWLKIIVIEVASRSALFCHASSVRFSWNLQCLNEKSVAQFQFVSVWYKPVPVRYDKFRKIWISLMHTFLFETFYGFCYEVQEILKLHFPARN